MEYDAEVMLEHVFADPTITQYLIRNQRDGLDTVCFYQRCQFSLGQQRLVLHFPFYPPFKQTPEVLVSVLDAEKVRTRITDQQKFGARVEIILNQPVIEGSDQQTILVECVATAGTGD